MIVGVCGCVHMRMCVSVMHDADVVSGVHEPVMMLVTVLFHTCMCE